MARLRRNPFALALLAALTLPVLGVVAGLRIGRVGDDDMEPSLRPGDWVLYLPAPVDFGDVVVLPDPLDPAHTVLRRVIGLPGQQVSFYGHRARVDGASLSQTYMGDWGDGEGAVMERGTWLAAFSHEASHVHVEPVEVPEGALFLAADHRDLALDSRWWGPVPRATLRGVVLLRLGEPDLWRAQVSFGRQTIRPEILEMANHPPEER